MQESLVSKNNSKRNFLARLPVVREIAFTQKILNVVVHHVFIIYIGFYIVLQRISHFGETFHLAPLSNLPSYP